MCRWLGRSVGSVGTPLELASEVWAALWECALNLQSLMLSLGVSVRIELNSFI